MSDLEDLDSLDANDGLSLDDSTVLPPVEQKAPLSMATIEEAEPDAPKKKKKKKKKSKKRDKTSHDDRSSMFDANSQAVVQDDLPDNKVEQNFPEELFVAERDTGLPPLEEVKKKKKKKKKKKRTEEGVPEEEKKVEEKEEEQEPGHEAPDTKLTIHSDVDDEEGKIFSDDDMKEDAKKPASFMDRFRRTTKPKENEESDSEEGKDELSPTDGEEVEEKSHTVTTEEARAVETPPFITYFTKDPIENLRLRITVRPAPPDDLSEHAQTAKGLHLLMKAKKTHEELENEDMENEDNANKKKVHVKEVGGEQQVTFSWQQKRFTAREVLSYVRDRQLPDTPLANKYSVLVKEDVLKINNEKNQQEEQSSNAIRLAQEYVSNIDGYSIGSYVEEDGYINPAEFKHLPIVSHRDEHNPLAKRILEARKHKGHGGNVHSRELDYQSMYIVASVDLKKGRAITSINRWKKAQAYGNEVVLVEIRAFGNGTFQISPGFAQMLEEKKENKHDKDDPTLDEMLGKDWHTFIAPSSKVKYWYRIENLSQPKASDEQHKMKIDSNVQMLMSEDVDAPTKAISYDFEPTPNQFGKVRLNCFGEIVKGFNFDVDDSESIYIEYELNFGDRWVWSANDRFQRTKAVTPCAETYVKPCAEGEGEGIPGEGMESTEQLQANFSFPFEFELLGQEGHVHIPEKKTRKQEIDGLLNRKTSKRAPGYDDDNDDDEQDDGDESFTPHMHDPPLPYPVMYFQVSSLDSWRRHRVLGYGYTKIPDTPGSHKIQVKTWMPVGGIKSRLDHFFVGGSQVLKDMKLSGGPVGDDNVGMGLGMGKGFSKQYHSDQARSFFLNKAGWRSESSGTIELRINCIQTRHDAEEHRIVDIVNPMTNWRPLLKPSLQGDAAWRTGKGATKEDIKKKHVHQLKNFAKEVGNEYVHNRRR